MTKLNAKSEKIHRFILDNVEKYPENITKMTALNFNISRQAVNNHFKKLVLKNVLKESGQTRNKTYELVTLLETTQTYEIKPGLDEFFVWRDHIQVLLGPVPKNVLDIWHYGFTEMFNNAIDHSSGSQIIIRIKKTAAFTEINIADNGVGIFKKIQTTLNLLDERHAVLELSKGKLTTDPLKHSGQGIFFTSRMFDSYSIISGEVSFLHEFDSPEDWILDNGGFVKGTMVNLILYNSTTRTDKEIYDQYTSGNDYAFDKTIVPVSLAKYGTDRLISRSQAKWVLARVELFKQVIFDFTGVDFIGQAFADEIFRVFAIQHPEVELLYANANVEVEQMIKRAKAG